MKKLLTALVTAAAIAITALVAVSPAGAQTHPEVDKELWYTVDGGIVVEETEFGERWIPIIGGEIYTDGKGVINLADGADINVMSFEMYFPRWGGTMSFNYEGLLFSGQLEAVADYVYFGDFESLLADLEMELHLTPAS